MSRHLSLQRSVATYISIHTNACKHECKFKQVCSYTRFVIFQNAVSSVAQSETAGKIRLSWLFMFLAKFSILPECTNLQKRSSPKRILLFILGRLFHMEVNKLLVPLIKALLPELYLLELQGNFCIIL